MRLAGVMFTFYSNVDAVVSSSAVRAAGSRCSRLVSSADRDWLNCRARLLEHLKLDLRGHPVPLWAFVTSVSALDPDTVSVILLLRELSLFTSRDSNGKSVDRLPAASPTRWISFSITFPLTNCLQDASVFLRNNQTDCDCCLRCRQHDSSDPSAWLRCTYQV